MKKRYTNPFSKESEMYAQKLDAATISADFNQIEFLLGEIANILPNLDPASQSCLYYSIGTVYSDFAKVKGLTFEESLRKQLYNFRKSADIIERSEYSKPEYAPYVRSFKCNLYTNYANALSNCGRKIAAIEQYRKALNIRPSYGMTLGNLGRIYQDYGAMDYDNRHRDFFHHFAYSLLRRAIECPDPGTYEDAKSSFRRTMEEYDPLYRPY